MIDTVVFDLGGVLVDWDPRHLYRKLIADPAAMERFLAEVCTPAWNERQDAGRPWAQATAELRARFPGHADLIDAFHQRWEETLAGAKDDTVAVLAQLHRRRMRLLALTNWSAETFPVARRRFAFLEWFEGIVVSGEERLIKPDPVLFKRLLDRYALVPQRTLYIDDSPANVAAAQALGMHGWHFRDAGGLRAELVTLGLLDASPVAPQERRRHG